MSHKSDLISENIEKYLKEHENKEILRFITCGSVDDGKSTLIGRLLHDSKMIFEDQLAAIEKDSKKSGTTGEEIDLALLVDGLQSEREQGITIDVAYRFYSTDKKKYIIADTPGHEQYTRNMATGASTAQLAVILIDARYGVQTQTKRHSYIVNLLGIKNVVVAINKMDLVDFSQEVFEKIKSDYEMLNGMLNIPSVTYIPMSALKGDNVVNRSQNMQWYSDLPLMEFLDSLELESSEIIAKESFRFPVQYVNRPHLNFRGFCGTIASGEIAIGDEVTVLPSYKTSKIKEIIEPYAVDKQTDSSALKTLKTANAPMAVTLTTEDEIDISRGDMIVKSGDIPETTRFLEVMLVWMNEASMSLNSEYLIKRATSTMHGKFNNIVYKQDVNTFEKLNDTSVELNEIAKVQLVLDGAIAYDKYADIPETGSFIVIDKYTNNTVAAGMIVESFNSTENVSFKEYSEAEKALNAYICKHYPEWECKDISHR